MSNENDDSYQRHVPPQLPSGFKAIQMDDILIVDFLTAFPRESQQIFSSVALTKDVAENLVAALSRFIEDDEDEDDNGEE